MAGRLPFIGVDELEKENVRVVFQGVEGAYSQAAMQQCILQQDHSCSMGALVCGWRYDCRRWQIAVLLIENSNAAGSVNDIKDLLVELETISS